jgi:Ran GTPase-activating protein (RanGAP) involved in mRNA processing and transport
MNCAIGNTNIIHGKRPIFNGFTKIKCDRVDTNADIINLSDLLIGYSATSNLSDFVTAAADGAHTKLTINHNGTGSGNSVTIISYH